MTDQRFPPCCRLRRGVDFRRVYARKQIASDGRMTIYGCENDLGYARLGLSVSTRVGPAVVRNRWKRLLREAFRLNRLELPAGVDFVVIPRAGSQPELHSLSDSLLRLAKRAAAKAQSSRREVP